MGVDHDAHYSWELSRNHSRLPFERAIAIKEPRSRSLVAGLGSGEQLSSIVSVLLCATSEHEEAFGTNALHCAGFPS
jgi:hypothetical protein